MKKSTEDCSVTLAVAMVFFGAISFMEPAESRDNTDGDVYTVDQYGNRTGLASQTRNGKTRSISPYGSPGLVTSVIKDGKIYEVFPDGMRGRQIGVIE